MNLIDIEREWRIDSAKADCDYDEDHARKSEAHTTVFKELEMPERLAMTLKFGGGKHGILAWYLNFCNQARSAGQRVEPADAYLMAGLWETRRNWSIDT